MGIIKKVKVIELSFVNSDNEIIKRVYKTNAKAAKDAEVLASFGFKSTIDVVEREIEIN